MVYFIILFLIGILLFYDMDAIENKQQAVKQRFDGLTHNTKTTFITLFGKQAMYKRATNSIARCKKAFLKPKGNNSLFGQHSMHKRALNNFA